MTESLFFALDERIDFILHKIASTPTLTMEVHHLYEVSVLDEETYLLDHALQEKGLIKVVKNGRAITSKGLDIANFGGWLNYQKQLRRERKWPVKGSAAYVGNDQAIEQLRKENEELQNTLRILKEESRNTSTVIANLLRQNRVTKLLMFIGGAVFGFALAILLSYALSVVF